MIIQGLLLKIKQNLQLQEEKSVDSSRCQELQATMKDLKNRLQFNKEIALESLTEKLNQAVALFFKVHCVPPLGLLTPEITQIPNSKHNARDCAQFRIYTESTAPKQLVVENHRTEERYLTAVIELREISK